MPQGKLPAMQVQRLDHMFNFTLTEQDHMDGEKEQAERLSMIVRNLKDVTAYTANGTPYILKPKLTYEELKYLGF